jgi:hypothetical protein
VEARDRTSLEAAVGVSGCRRDRRMGVEEDARSADRDRLMGEKEVEAVGSALRLVGWGMQACSGQNCYESRAKVVDWQIASRVLVEEEPPGRHAQFVRSPCLRICCGSCTVGACVESESGCGCGCCFDSCC